MIRKCKLSDRDSRPVAEQRWCLYTKNGDRLLGRHPTKESAERQERAIQMRKHAEVIRYCGHNYVKAERNYDPRARLPVGTIETDVLSARTQIAVLSMFSKVMSNTFDKMLQHPGMEKLDFERKQYDKSMVRVDDALKKLHSIVKRLADKVEEQQATIDRFRLAVRELQKKQASVPLDSILPIELTNKRKAKMQTQQPAAIKHDGHVYVLAKDDNEDLEFESIETEVPDDMPEEEAAEMDLLSQFKQDWQTILSKLPEDLEVDEEFEAALTGIENFIQEFEAIHEEYGDAGEELPEVEEVDESEVEKLD